MILFFFFIFLIFQGSFMKHILKQETELDEFLISSDNSSQNVGELENLETSVETLVGQVDQDNVIFTADDVFLIFGTNFVYFQPEDLEINNQIEEQRATSSSQTHIVELFIVADNKAYNKWFKVNKESKDKAVKSLKYFYSHVINGVNERYKSIRGLKITFQLIGLYVATTVSDSEFTESSDIKSAGEVVDALKALKSFGNWLKNKKSLPSFDAASLFTGYSMGNYNGLAYVSAICYPHAIAISREWAQYATIDVAAHEFGHILGSSHDGKSNTCNSNDQYIMAPVRMLINQENLNRSLTFSTCSQKAIISNVEKLNKIGRNCMVKNEKPLAKEDPLYVDSNLLSSFPGQKYSLHQQCQLLYGNESYFCNIGKPVEEICTSTYCYDPSAKTCRQASGQRADDGTTCGNKKWCMGSYCIEDQRAPVLSNTKCVFGDFPGSFQQNGQKLHCSDLNESHKKLCYKSYILSSCCETCNKIANKNNQGCEFGDKGSWCSSSISQMGKSRACSTSYIRSICCESCK